LVSQGVPTAIARCKYLDFKGAPNSNCDVKFLASKEAPTAILMCSTMLSKGPPTAIVMCKYYAFKGAPNSNCNV